MNNQTKIKRKIRKLKFLMQLEKLNIKNPKIKKLK